MHWESFQGGCIAQLPGGMALVVELARTEKVKEVGERKVYRVRFGPIRSAIEYQSKEVAKLAAMDLARIILNAASSDLDTLAATFRASFAEHTGKICERSP